MFMRLASLLALGVLLGGCAGAATPPAGTSGPRAAITADALRQDLYAFAADSFLGRETGTRAGERAAKFLADRLVRLGVEPAGDSMYHQRVPLVRQSFGSASTVVVRIGQSTIPLELGTDVVPLINLGPGAPLPRRSAEGDLVFAGYGMQPSDFSGITQAGRVIVMLHGAPPGVTDSAQREELESQNAMGMRLGRAVQLQPAAIVLMMTGGATEFYEQIAPELMRSMQPAPGDQSTSDAERPLPMILLGRARPNSPLLPANWETDPSPQALTGRRFTGRIELRQEQVTAYNVVGVVRGTDPQLNKTYVAFGAHYDHVGIQPNASGDSIANGADDDGSGSVSLLALAAAFRANPPRRSLLFVWHTAEEKGLFGSQYYTNNPTVPIDSIVAMLNLDMVGRNGGPVDSWNTVTQGAAAENRLYVVGPNAAPNNQSRALGAILDTVNARQSMPMTLDREWDSPDHPERIYFRSDHYNYAQKGIPILFFTTGLHEDYHKVSDEPQKINYDKMTRINALLLDLGSTLGNRATRPR